jgi:hypothetical protein
MQKIILKQAEYKVLTTKDLDWSSSKIQIRIPKDASLKLDCYFQKTLLDQVVIEVEIFQNGCFVLNDQYIDTLGQVDWKVILRGKESIFRTESRIKMTQQNELDLSHRVGHQGKFSISDIRTKAVLKDKAYFRYTSKIEVEKGVKGCNGEEDFQALLVGEYAKVSVIPDLAIKNNVVSSRHAVGIRQISKETLFYLMSRGISKKESQQMLETGFLAI